MTGQVLRAWAWIDVQVALWSVLLLPAAVVLALLLRGKLPVWRKGIWLGAMLLPLLMVMAAALLPPHSRWVPADWLGAGGTAMGPAMEEPSGMLALSGILYGGWIVLNLLVEAGALWRLRRLLKQASPVTAGPVTALYTGLVRGVGCARPPRLVQSADAASPFIAASPWSGLTIVLPESLVFDGATTALRAVLAHELAHARAGDPWFGRLLSWMRCLLPLTWLSSLVASRIFWEDAAEQTGDVRALRGSGLSHRDYVTALKDMALAATGAAMPGTFSFTPHAGDLPSATRRLVGHLVGRISALHLAEHWSEPVIHSAGSCARAIVAGGLLFVLAGRPEVRAMLQDPRGMLPHPVAAVPQPAASVPESAAEVRQAPQSIKEDQVPRKPDPRRDALEEKRQIDKSVEQHIRNHEGLEL